MHIRNIQEIVDWRLCLGCGACAYVCPEKHISLHNFIDQGIRPVTTNANCTGCSECLAVCPVYENDHEPLNQRPGNIPELLPAFGPVLELWEGFAVDEEIRHQGSSGG